MSSRIAKGLIAGAQQLLHLALVALALLFVFQLVVGSARAAEAVRAVRVWPAQDYTRVTFESAAPLRHNLLLIGNPQRLVVDLEDVDMASVQQNLAGKILPNDPYIANVRVGQFRPGVVRVVLDLKAQVKPQMFALAPIGNYGNRLVLDIYPAEPIDPLMALLQKNESAQEGSLDELINRLPQPEKGTGSGKERPGTEIKRLVTVAIDAGHGGEDPGARGRRGTYEKNVTLTIARRLKSLVDAEPNMRGFLTRDGDYYLPLATRVDKATRVRADIFVSVHADAFNKSHVRGSSVFALSERGATSAMAKMVAQSENYADRIGGVNFVALKDPYLKMTVADLNLTAQINDSLKLGRAVLGELGSVNTLHKDVVEQAGFAVLKAPEIPSILVETAFISNPEEERRLTSEPYQEKIARAILRGVERYIANNPPLSRPTLAANSLN